MFMLIFLPFCRSRPLSVCLLSMTLCPPSTVLFCLFSSQTLFPPSPINLSSSCHPPYSVSPSWPGIESRPPIPSRVRVPSLPQVSVCGPQAALVPGGLWGLRSPVGLPLQHSGCPAGCLFNNPNAGGSAPREARTPRCAQDGHDDGPAHTQIHKPAAPRKQARARRHSPAHP